MYKVTKDITAQSIQNQLLAFNFKYQYETRRWRKRFTYYQGQGEVGTYHVGSFVEICVGCPDADVCIPL